MPSASSSSAAHCTRERRWPSATRASTPTGITLKHAHSWKVGGSSSSIARKTALFCTMKSSAGIANKRNGVNCQPESPSYSSDGRSRSQSAKAIRSLRSSVKKTADGVSNGVAPPLRLLASSTSSDCVEARTVSATAESSFASMDVLFPEAPRLRRGARGRIPHVGGVGVGFATGARQRQSSL